MQPVIANAGNGAIVSVDNRQRADVPGLVVSHPVPRLGAFLRDEDHEGDPSCDGRRIGLPSVDDVQEAKAGGRAKMFKSMARQEVEETEYEQYR